MPQHQDRPLTKADREWIFRRATAALPRKYGAAIKEGMTDAQLTVALKNILGIFGGRGAPGEPSFTFMGAGLRIWGGWRTVNHVIEPPLYAGMATIAMARATYGIADPDNPQLRLF